MRRRAFLGLVAGAGALAVSGCTTVADARVERGNGVIVNYAAPYDEVWSALVGIMKELNLRLTTDKKAEGYMLAENSASIFSLSERIAVFVERIGTKGNSRVEVTSGRAAGANIMAPDRASVIHELLGRRFRRL